MDDQPVPGTDPITLELVEAPHCRILPNGTLAVRLDGFVEGGTHSVTAIWEPDYGRAEADSLLAALVMQVGGPAPRLRLHGSWQERSWARPDGRVHSRREYRARRAEMAPEADRMGAWDDAP